MLLVEQYCEHCARVIGIRVSFKLNCDKRVIVLHVKKVDASFRGVVVEGMVAVLMPSEISILSGR